MEKGIELDSDKLGRFNKMQRRGDWTGKEHFYWLIGCGEASGVDNEREKEEGFNDPHAR